VSQATAIDSSTALDTTIAVVTPENISFDYQLAGPFQRLTAYAIDVAVQYAILAFLFFVAMIAAAVLSITSMSSFAVGGFLVVNFLISFFYGTILETYWNGRTFGKWVCGLRVIDIEGRPSSGGRAFIRNLLRAADLMPFAAINGILDTMFDVEGLPPMYMIPSGMVAFVSMACTRRMQRLGDLAAGTMVVIDEKALRLPIAKIDDARVPALASFIPADYRVSRSMSRMLAMYVERRAYLTAPRRREVARHIVSPLIDRFAFRLDIDPDLLMMALYYQTFLADPRAEVEFGSLAGFSPLAKDAHRPAPAIPQGTTRQEIPPQETTTS
jgi:uncharacterized RDD family membrane protein YckC